jgi:arylsulfatase A-like enzyme
MADEAIQHIKQLKEIAPGKPWFVYYVPGATHAPHHPTPEWTKKISDMHLFDAGHHARERPAHALAEGIARVGFPQLGREEALS